MYCLPPSFVSFPHTHRWMGLGWILDFRAFGSIRTEDQTKDTFFDIKTPRCKKTPPPLRLLEWLYRYLYSRERDFPRIVDPYHYRRVLGGLVYYSTSRQPRVRVLVAPKGRTILYKLSCRLGESCTQSSIRRTNRHGILC